MKIRLELDALSAVVRWVEDQESDDEEFVILSSCPEQVDYFEEALNKLLSGLPFEIFADARYLKEVASVKGEILLPNGRLRYVGKPHDRIVIRRTGIV